MSAWSRVITKSRNGSALSLEATVTGSSLRFSVLLWMALMGFAFPGLARSQSKDASIHFDKETQVFRIDAADMSYVLGINEKKQVQSLYWGKRLSGADTFAHSDPGSSSFDASTNTTQQEFVSWGGGLYVEHEIGRG